jgi:hypothetical protein
MQNGQTFNNRQPLIFSIYEKNGEIFCINLLSRKQSHIRHFEIVLAIIGRQKIPVYYDRRKGLFFECRGEI